MNHEWTVAQKRWLWGCTAALVVTILLCGGLGVAGYGELRGAMAHKAVYAGGLEFFGEADGWFGTTYNRMNLWNPQQPPPAGAPSVRLHIGGRPYDARTLTADALLQLGGYEQMPGEAVLLDAQGRRLVVRLHGQYPTVWLNTGAPPPSNAAGVTALPIEISIGGGPSFTLPIAHDDLERFAGPSDETMSRLRN